MSITQFNVRVYGLLIREKKVLICKEYHKDLFLVKFPGGGLEFGEGIIDCLKREWKEELDIDIKVGPHFYTTDFFVHSAFRDSDQLISVYYEVLTSADIPDQYDGISYEWMEIKNVSAMALTLPVDKIVMERLVQNSV